MAALLTGLGLWAQEDHPRRAGAGCFLPAVQTLLMKQPARPHQGPCPSQTRGPFHSESGRCLCHLGKAGGSREGLSGLRF